VDAGTLTFALEVSSQARRQLSRVPRKTYEALVAFMEGPLVDNPQRVGKPLIDEFDGYLSARVGVYRIVYSIDEVVFVVGVVAIGHRSTIYGRPPK
jgi:mRNA interferase RelE/StbE